MDLEQVKKINDRKYPGSNDIKSLTTQCICYSLMSIGLSIRLYYARRNNKSLVFDSVCSLGVLYLLFRNVDVLGDLVTHQMKYPELYPINEKDNN